MRGAMVNCNQVQTEVITEGRWIEEEPLPHSTKQVVLVITGNPGLPGFYESFIKAINSKLSFDTPVWVVGHAGHVQPPENLDIAMPSNKKWRDHYGLTAQVQHKAEFIKTYVPEDVQLYLIGHSIGAWVLLNLLRDPDINKRVKKCYMLFPTIEYMAETRNGRIFHNIISRVAPLWIFLSWFFTTIFPSFLQTFMISVFSFFYGIPAKYNKVVQKMLDPRVLYRIINLAKEELKYIKEADHETISKYSDKLWFYYGTIDGWVPVRYYKNMMTKHPNLNAQLCQRGFYHSFVLKNDVDMGHIVGELINNE
ncbi:PREDICTED: lipid droplet-associated hydrolase [Dinoponera quadriceps]|uniref:Lipid droplet-associated hydrolase n=1 Tax=Dinoponera quadriceps TaxID=609295 RepID=A0A6P3X449_DINQU|nr:PREDICTED: lipid droplet-associated hydrolase [Dinoponera quadriceps]